MSSSTIEWLLSGDWQHDLKDAGFTCGRGRRRFTRDGVSFDIEDNWPVFTADADGEAPEDMLSGQLGRPGLWKWIIKRGEPRQHFELPPAVFESLDPVDETGAPWSPFQEAITWAMDTRASGRITGWTPPPEEELASVIPPSRLTVQHGAYVCQGQVERAPGRLALRMPIVSEVPPDLSQERRSWLRCLLMAAMNKWRLVRMGILQDESGLMVSAEIDLTGVPRSLLEPMASIALPALRGATEWVVCATVFLTLSRNGCRLLEAGAVRPNDNP